MSYTVKGYYNVTVDEEYEDMSEAVERAREIVTEHESSGVYIDGGGVWLAVNAARSEVQA